MKDHFFFKILLGLLSVAFFCISAAGNPDESDAGYDTSSTDTAFDINHIEPAPDFFKAFSPNYLKFGFQGVINSVSDYLAYLYTPGYGDFQFRLGENKIPLTENIYAYEYTFPPSEPEPMLRNKTYVIIQGDQIIEGSGAHYTYHYLTLGLPQKTLVSQLSTAEPLFAFPGSAWISLYEIDLTSRLDGVYLSRYCYVTTADYAVSDSALFIDPSHNTQFGPGENLLVWGNIALIEALEITAETEESLCYYYQNDTEISRAQYLEELTKDGTEFDCEIPADYFDPFSNDYGLFRFKGKINDGTADPTQFRRGIGSYQVEINAQPLVVDDYYTQVYSYQENGSDYLALVSLGSVIDLSPTHYQYLYTTTYLEVEALKAFKEEHPDEYCYRGDGYTFLLYQGEEKYAGTTAYYKFCPVAISDASQTQSSLFICHKANEAFGPGEELQVAGNIGLTTDRTIIAEFLKTEAECLCSTDIAEINCAVFDGL